ncbi:Na+/H+ antiporter subunit G [Corynebacterium sp. sy017]|uniref:Na+/H+ antiporter subunit G n=1 Tax=unclassified Corynebacterium TaxID=2624378 RepID=UPI001185DADC|nr:MULTISPECIES: Na+/H+ antiporter subunit G [unclassified Corynebacterium]MBP3089424.1 Na+/H+ antiporter subunit G [Corynebacterium sp. sy017]TSD90890.1 Na+/H+ antiporter subunit G [Corynebacterium sp. SY003]
MILEIIAALCAILAGILMLTTAIALWRAPDALSRVNLLGPATGVAVPALIVAKLCVDGGSAGEIIRGILAICAFWVVLAIGSFIMGRSLYGLTQD